jgi:hypothetical protein
VEITSATLIALAVIVFINTLFIAGLAVALFLINKKVDEALDKAAPLLQRATETLGRVEGATVQIQQKVDHVLAKTTHLVDNVSERLDTTTAIAEEAVTEPLISAASLMAGIQRGLRTYSERSGMKGDGQNGG